MHPSRICENAPPATQPSVATETEAWMNLRFACLVVLASSLWPGCNCGPSSDEEILRERIDTTKVHLYVAMKIAVTKTGDQPEVLEARERILEALEAAHRLSARTHHGNQGSGGAPDPANAQVDPVTAEDVVATGEDLFTLARALYALRAEGQEIVQSGNEDELTPVLPVLLREVAPDAAIIDQIDMKTEHGIMLMALFAFKFHPRSPMPIPPEVLLYEAWMADADEMQVTGLGPVVRALKAYVYSMEELCDLAVVEGRALDEEGLPPEDLGAMLDEFGADSSGLEEAELKSGVAALRALAHGSTALCYMKRDEQEEANDELQRFVDAAEEADVPPEDTALIRAYLAYQDEDIAATRRYLTQAKESRLLDDRDREEIDELLGYLREDGDRDALTDFYDKAFFATFTVKLVFHQLERAGLTEEMEGTVLYRTTYDWAATAGGTIGAARDAVPSFSAAADQSKSWFEGLFE